MDVCYITVWINACNHTPITVVNFRQNSKLLIFSIIPEVFNFECHNWLFLGGYIPLESLTKLCDMSGRTHDIHEPVIGQIHPFFLSKIDKSMRTSRINRCEPRYAGTEFTNRGITEAYIRNTEAYIRLRKRVIGKRISAYGSVYPPLANAILSRSHETYRAIRCIYPVIWDNYNVICDDYHAIWDIKTK